jgi:hypothetical protein
VQPGDGPTRGPGGDPDAPTERSFGVVAAPVSGGLVESIVGDVAGFYLGG